MKTPFLGGTYVSRSKDLADNRCVNLFPELVETKEGKAVGAFYGCPGYYLLSTIGSGPIRGAYRASTGVLYVVSGNGLYSVSATWQATLVGTFASSTGPVKMVDNGNQLLIVDGTGGYCLVFKTGAFTQPLPGTPGVIPATLAYQDGFALVNFSGTNQFYQSNLNDFTTWQALNFSSADSNPGAIIGMYDLHREVWLFKTDRTEVWVNAGLPGFAFQRLQGVQIPEGCVAPYSIDRIGDSIMWLGQDEQGQGIVYMSNGYAAVPVSTHAISFAIQALPTISDAIGFTYQQDKHFFYVLTFPSGNLTFVFDMSSKLWHERATFNANGTFSRHVANCHAFAYGVHAIGDFSNGNLYAWDMNTYTDNGNVHKWLRSWRALPPSQESFVQYRFESLEISCQTGVNVPDGLNPQMMLRWSDDGGYNWSNELWADSNQTGNTSPRVIFKPLGQTKRGTGYDRIFELSGTDPVPVALIDANLEASPT